MFRQPQTKSVTTSDQHKCDLIGESGFIFLGLRRDKPKRNVNILNLCSKTSISRIWAKCLARTHSQPEKLKVDFLLTSTESQYFQVTIEEDNANYQLFVRAPQRIYRRAFLDANFCASSSRESSGVQC